MRSFTPHTAYEETSRFKANPTYLMIDHLIFSSIITIEVFFK